MMTSNLQNTSTRPGERKLRGHRSHSARVYISRQENRRPESAHVLFEKALTCLRNRLEIKVAMHVYEMWQI